MDLTTINKPFGEIGLSLQLELFQYWLTGGKIECLGSSKGSIVAKNPGWYKYYIYRAYKEPEVPASIDWSHVSSGLNYIAMDMDGRWYMYGEKPSQGSRQWLYSEICVNPKNFASFKPGTIKDWTKTLVERPR